MHSPSPAVCNLKSRWHGPPEQLPPGRMKTRRPKRPKQLPRGTPPACFLESPEGRPYSSRLPPRVHEPAEPGHHRNHEPCPPPSSSPAAIPATVSGHDGDKLHRRPSARPGHSRDRPCFVFQLGDAGRLVVRTACLRCRARGWCRESLLCHPRLPGEILKASAGRCPYRDLAGSTGIRGASGRRARVRRCRYRGFACLLN